MDIKINRPTRNVSAHLFKLKEQSHVLNNTGSWLDPLLKSI